MLSDVVTVAVIENSISDHLPIILKFKSSRKEQTTPLSRKITPQKVEHFVADLDSELQNCIKSDTDNDIGILIDCMSRMTNKKSEITQGILKSIKAQNRLYAKYLKSQNDDDLKIYKAYRNKLTHTKQWRN